MKNLCEKPAEPKFLAIADRLAQNASLIKYGLVSVELQIHDGRVVSTTYATTEKTRLVKEEGK